MAYEGLKTQMFRHSILETATTQKEGLGTLRILDDGRKFRYAKNGAVALVAGTALMAPAVVAHHVEMATVANVAVGSKSVTVTLGATAVTANQYAGGFLQINKGSGIGHQYKVASHPVHAGTGNLIVTLEEPVVDALASADTECSLIANPYAAVVVTTGANVIVVGVTPCDVAAGSYFWVQTGGLACAETNGTPAVGVNLFAAAGGELDAGPNTTTASPLAAGPKVGYLMVVGVDNEAKPVFLTLD